MQIVGLKRGILINFIAKYSNVLIQLVITSILARLLTPTEFGTVSVVTIFTTFFNLLGDMGIQPAIVQYKELSEEDLRVIFTFTILVALVLAALFYIFSYLLEYLYNDKAYISIGHILCWTIVFNVLSIVPRGILFRDKQFKQIGTITVLSTAMSGAVTIPLAFAGFGYHSLVINSVIQSLLIFSLLFKSCRLPLKPYAFTWEPIRRIKSFSMYQFLFNLINYFSRNLDNLLIGKYIGMSALGYYDKAYQLMLYPIQNLTFVITPVLQPILSDYRSHKSLIFDNYKKIIKILSLIGVFIAVYCYFSSKEIIMILFGARWLGVINCFKILSVSIPVQIVLSSIGGIFQALGNTRALFRTGLSNSVFMILLIILSLFTGRIEYIAGALVVGFTVNFFRTFYVLLTVVFSESYIRFLVEFKNTVIVCFAMSLSFIAYNMLNIHVSNMVISATLKLAVALVSYILGLVATREHIFLRRVLLSRWV